MYRKMTPVSHEGQVAWRSPSNIALIKYWGKKEDQIPQNPSLSFTLDKSFTETHIEYRFSKNSGKTIDFTFEGKSYPEFESRIQSFVRTLAAYLPFIDHLSLKIESHNSFPHSSGIASSASAMSALALCLSSLEQRVYGNSQEDADFFQKASFLARLGSGSACRSVCGGWSVWGKTSLFEGSNNETSVKAEAGFDPFFSEMADAILIVDSKKKKVSSSQGHRSMENHPFADARYRQANDNLRLLRAALTQGDLQSFITVTENEALSLHAMMMSSISGYSLLSEATWKIIGKIRDFRKSSGLFMTFTLDAGPNVHLMYHKKDTARMHQFIEEELLKFLEDGKWIDDSIGNGPVRLQPEERIRK